MIHGARMRVNSSYLYYYLRTCQDSVVRCCCNGLSMHTLVSVYLFQLLVRLTTDAAVGFVRERCCSAGMWQLSHSIWWPGVLSIATRVCRNFCSFSCVCVSVHSRGCVPRSTRLMLISSEDCAVHVNWSPWCSCVNFSVNLSVGWQASLMVCMYVRLSADKSVCVCEWDVIQQATAAVWCDSQLMQFIKLLIVMTVMSSDQDRKLVFVLSCIFHC